MIWPFFKKEKDKLLGIDVGSSAIKIVELSSQKGQVKLDNYAFCSLLPFYESFKKGKAQEPILFSPKQLSQIILAILKEAKIRSRQAFFSLPSFATFFTSFNIPLMSEEEANEAIRFEARKYVPLPLSEVTLDWVIIEEKPLAGKQPFLKVLLVAVPNDIIAQYRSIAENSKLDILSLEAEVFAFVRSLTKQLKKTTMIVDIGAQTTTCNLVDNRVLKISHNIDLAGNEFTDRISKTTGLSWKEAEEIKKREGLKSGNEQIKSALYPLIDLIIGEINKLNNLLYQSEGKQTERYILVGGSSLLPGLREYFQKKLKKEIIFGTVFDGFLFPPILNETLKELGPIFSVAVGMAFKGIKKKIK